MKETLEETAENESEYLSDWEDKDIYQRGFIAGAKWQQKNSYSEEEVYDLMDKREHYWVRYKNYYTQSYIDFDEWFEQFKKK
jgi:hypothetical protein